MKDKIAGVIIINRIQAANVNAIFSSIMFWSPKQMTTSKTPKPLGTIKVNAQINNLRKKIDINFKISIFLENLFQSMTNKKPIEIIIKLHIIKIIFSKFSFFIFSEKSFEY